MIPPVEQIARICHEINRTYCEALGDYSQVPWEETSAETQLSAINGVQQALVMPDPDPSTMHSLWCQYKRQQGWVWGEEKNEELKTHPCLVSFQSLPIDQQVKDHLFLAIVQNVRELIGA